MAPVSTVLIVYACGFISCLVLLFFYGKIDI